MKRLEINKRSSWKQLVESQGLIYHSTEWPDGSVRNYWNEGVFYAFEPKQVLELERASSVLSYMCLAAAEEIIERNRFKELGIPSGYEEAIKNSWESDPPSVYGRFDLCYDGTNPPKLLEFNADTPTSLLETGVIQWKWLEDLHPELDQWNSIHEKLIKTWKNMDPYILPEIIHVAHCGTEDSGEDLMNAAYMRDCINQAGYKTVGIHVQDIGWDEEANQFVDLDYQPIEAIFKLYPWEWLLDYEFGKHVIETMKKVVWVEPVWKMVLSNKGLLPILWELFPNHPNLLPAYFGHPHELTQWVRKPLLSREGNNISIVADDLNLETDGIYGEEGFIFQDYCPLPDFGGNRPVIGSWMIGWQPAGMGIRESDGPITDNLSRFVPHVITDIKES